MCWNGRRTSVSLKCWWMKDVHELCSMHPDLLQDRVDVVLRSWSQSTRLHLNTHHPHPI